MLEGRHGAALAARARSGEGATSDRSPRRPIVRCAWCGRYAIGARWYEPAIWRLLLHVRKRRRLVSHGICPECWKEVADDVPYPGG